MIKGIYRHLTVSALALVLAGCVTTEQAPAPVEPANQDPVAVEAPPLVVPVIPDLKTIELPEPTIPAVPTVRTYAWSSAISPLVNQILQADGVTPGSVLLVDQVNNRTNGSLQTGSATQALVDAMANNRTFILVSTQQLALAKQQLGLSPQDSLGSRSKAIGIARKVGAKYVLYSNASGNVNAPTLKMQLMLVQTGEIIWSGNSAVSQTN
ncbi:penicillin-binding protein activator LpoB [uncultured Cedecea sp.]|uniref:penicillin-binding protein activator LpoB n=1 Tax=uncultured Cedecea sp. TaxID=988762 RepID=UPI002620E2F7|nr:penicillin-binding protein activator LpoB [uncultured Cedecea sp.]